MTAIEAGRLSLSVEPVAVSEVVRDAVELTASQAHARGITLKAELGDADDWYVVADVRSRRQMLVHLLSNGVKFNSSAGTVTLETAAPLTALPPIAPQSPHRPVP